MSPIASVSRRYWSPPSWFLLAPLLILLLPLRDAPIVTPQAKFDHATQLFLHGHLEESQKEAENGYKQSAASDPKLASRFELLQAKSMVWRGIYEDALPVLESNKFPASDTADQIEKLVLEGVAYSYLQRFVSASETLSKAENLCATKADLTCGGVLRARGILAMEHGDTKDARRFFFLSLSFAREHHDVSLETTALLNLGWVELQNEHYDEALDWLTLAYRAGLDLGDENRVQGAMGNLGWAYLNLGDTERALGLFIDAKDRAEKLGNVRQELEWLTTSSGVYWSIGDFTRANESYSRALPLAKQINSKEDIINTLEDLSHASIDAGKLNQANDYLQQLAPLLSANSNRLDQLDVTFAQARIASAQRRDKDAEALFRIVETDPASQTSMRLGAEHEFARLYEIESNKEAADRMYRTSLATFESARDQLKNEESKLPFLANATRVYDDYIHFLVAQGKTGEALALADHSRARTLEQGLGLTSQARSAASPSLHPNAIARKTNATLLFYWLSERESYLWAITPAKTSMFTLPPRNQIVPMIDRYRKALLGLRDPLETSNADGLALYRILLAPARDLIPPGSDVVILNDGVLSELNFETLIAPEPNPHYFIEDATLISAPSLYLLATTRSAGPSGNKLLLIGDAVSPNVDYPALPKAPAEMKQIGEHFSAQDETVFAREQATSGSYLASAPRQFAYIHFVAHGVASRTDPLDSAIILSRSSTAEDSFKLHARDIMQSPIHARLVTISSCYGSGARSFAGEGLVGLAWAFLRAGAHNVIGGLWEVSDESTPRLMGALYQGLQDGMSPAAALRQAKLALLHSKSEFRKPFFWAPLQIYTGL